MKLFVGLGNPGQKHERNRHNVGFMAVDRIADQFSFPNWRKRFQAFASDGQISGERVLLLKPQTYMNESGRAVAEAARFLKIPVEEVFVFYDEIDLAPGKLKVKTGGGNAGHNGLRSLTAHLGNDYHRIRIGVGHPGRKDLVAHYVLNDFAKVEHEWLEPLLDAIAKNAGHLAKGESARFLSFIAQSLQPDDAGKSTAPDRPSQAKPNQGQPARNNDSGPTTNQSDKHQPQATKSADKTSGDSALAASLKKWLHGHKSGD